MPRVQGAASGGAQHHHGASGQPRPLTNGFHGSRHPTNPESEVRPSKQTLMRLVAPDVEELSFL